jgi:hypothetical protein
MRTDKCLKTTLHLMIVCGLFFAAYQLLGVIICDANERSDVLNVEQNKTCVGNVMSSANLSSYC